MIVNLRSPSARALADLVRVDRGTKFGNPFVMRSEADRERVVSQYRVWLWNQIKTGKITVEELKALHGKNLACWCAPKRCHAEILAQAASWAIDR